MKSNSSAAVRMRRLVYSAILAALVCIFTAYVGHIPTATGYIHFGDSMVYLAACLLPVPWAMAAAGIGAALADVLSGVPVWAPWTFVIKALMVPAFTCRAPKMLCPRNILALFAGAAITIFGYYFAEYFVYGELTALLTSLPAGLYQSGGSTLVFLILAAALDRAGVRQRLMA